VTNIFMQVSAILSRLEPKLARTSGVAKDQRCGKMTSLPTAGSRDAKIRLVSNRREAYEPKLRSCKDAALAEDDGAGPMSELGSKAEVSTPARHVRSVP
jgi:hypothetical protein